MLIISLLQLTGGGLQILDATTRVHRPTKKTLRTRLCKSPLCSDRSFDLCSLYPFCSSLEEAFRYWTLPLEYTDQRRRLFAQGFVSHLCALTGLSTCAHYIPSAAHWRRPSDAGRYHSSTPTNEEDSSHKAL